MRPRPRHGPARSPTQTSPCVVLVVVVVVAGEAAAWAGTITDLTTGLTRRSGKTSGLNEPPPNAICKMRRRSTVIVEDPPLARSMRRPRNIAKYPTARFRSSHNIRPAGIEGQCEDQHSAGGPGSAPRPCPLRLLAKPLPAAMRYCTGSPP
jgi:hypothetical protein